MGAPSARRSSPTPRGTKDVNSQSPAKSTETAPQPTLDDPAILAGLDHQAAIVSNALFPMDAVHALSLREDVSVTGMRVFLAQFRQDAGATGDVIERLLIDQLALAHFRAGRLHALAEETTQLEFRRLYIAAAARLLTAICQTVDTLRNYRDSSRRQKKRPVMPPEVSQAGTKVCRDNGRPRKECKSAQRNDK